MKYVIKQRQSLLQWIDSCIKIGQENTEGRNTSVRVEAADLNKIN